MRDYDLTSKGDGSYQRPYSAYIREVQEGEGEKAVAALEDRTGSSLLGVLTAFM